MIPWVYDVSGLEWKDLKKFTLREIELKNIRIDYEEYLNDSNPLKDACLRVSSFELEDSFSAKLCLFFDNSCFDRFENQKEKGRFIKKFEARAAQKRSRS
jgi:hypothetical protein